MPHYDKLTVDYYYFIKNADLKNAINSHKNDHLHRHEAKDFFNKTMDDLQVLTDNLSFDKPEDRSNLNLLFSNPMVNKVDRLAQSYQQLKGITELNRTRDSLILVEVNKELAAWGMVQ